VAWIGRTLSFELRPVPFTLSLARERVGSWLDDVGWPERDRDVAVAVVNEAVTNTIENGFGCGDASAECRVQVQIDVVPADVAHRRLVIAVQDNGGWKRPEIQTVDGLGLLLMDNLGEDLWIDGQADGTTVIVTVHAQR